MFNKCEYKNHEIEAGKGVFCYIDEPHGIMINMIICEDCYLEHLQKYYPDSRVTIYLTEQKRIYNAQNNRN
jgi:hypothetical protein